MNMTMVDSQTSEHIATLSSSLTLHTRGRPTVSVRDGETCDARRFAAQQNVRETATRANRSDLASDWHQGPDLGNDFPGKVCRKLLRALSPFLTVLKSDWSNIEQTHNPLLRNVNVNLLKAEVSRFPPFFAAWQWRSFLPINAVNQHTSAMHPCADPTWKPSAMAAFHQVNRWDYYFRPFVELR